MSSGVYTGREVEGKFASELDMDELPCRSLIPVDGEYASPSPSLEIPSKNVC